MVKVDGVDGAGSVLFEGQAVAHSLELLAHFRWSFLVELELPGRAIMVVEGVPHLVAGDVGCFA
ncbi:MAG: hypothetical protein C0168_03615, partial [Candidatus Aminicenantes bacterium]